MRSQNEDFLGWGRVGASAPSAHLFAVADGLGAYGGGDVASRMAVEVLLGRGAKVDAAVQATGPKFLRGAFDAANHAIFDAALDGLGARQMQTTMSALLLEPGEVHLGHVGDCRAYRLRGDSLELLSSDHTQVMEMLRMRMITPEQAAEHPARHALTRSLGADLIVRTDVRRDALLDGDCFLLCSDGLWGKVSAGEIVDALRGALDVACHGLVGLAVERGGEDNATALAIRVGTAGEARSRPQGWRRLIFPNRSDTRGRS